MKFSLARLDSVLDQMRMAGTIVTRIRGPKMALDLLSQELAARDGPGLAQTDIDGKIVTTYLGIPIGSDGGLKGGMYVILDMERMVP